MDPDNDELATVIPLHRPLADELRAQLRERLAARGAVTEDLAACDTLPATWRSTARRAARDLRRPVRTGQLEHDDGATTTVWAELTDWPRTPAEEEVTRASMRRSVDAIARDLPTPRHLGPVTD